MNKRLVLLMIIILVISLLQGCEIRDKIYNLIDKNEVEKVEESYVPVEVDKIKLKTISNSTVYAARVSSSKDVFVIPKMMGKISSIKFKLGNKVNKSNLLFVMDQTEIKDAVKKAESAVNSAKKNIESIKNGIEEANSKLKQIQDAYSKGYVSEEIYLQAKAATSEQPLIEAVGALNQAQMAYDKAVDVLNDTYITAPINGIITALNIEEGNIVSNQQPSMVISDLSKMNIDIYVSEDMINKLYSGKDVSLDIESVNLKNIKSKIDSVSPAPDIRTGLYKVTTVIDNKNNIIKPGMTASVNIDTDIKENAMVIKSEALVEENGLKKVFIFKDDIALEKEVLIGLDTGEYIEIISGLDINDKIIIKGQNYIENNSKIKVVKGN